VRSIAVREGMVRKPKDDEEVGFWVSTPASLMCIFRKVLSQVHRKMERYTLPLLSLFSFSIIIQFIMEMSGFDSKLFLHQSTVHALK
jgi:hypothetical protein